MASLPNRAMLMAIAELLAVQDGPHKDALLRAIEKATRATEPPRGEGSSKPAPAAAAKPSQRALSENELAQRLEQGDPDAIEQLVVSFHWTRHMITKKLCALRPREGEWFWVLPVERTISLNSTDAGLALLLFDHDPGLERYSCTKACKVEVTGFDTDRLLDGAYWRSRERTRGKLVQN